MHLVIGAVDYVTGQNKQLVLLVDEIAATKQINNFFFALSNIANYLVGQGRSVACVITGLGLQDWVEADINLEMANSRRPLTWIALQPAVDEESEGRLEEEFQKAVLHAKSIRAWTRNASWTSFALWCVTQMAIGARSNKCEWR